MVIVVVIVIIIVVIIVIIVIIVIVVVVVVIIIKVVVKVVYYRIISIYIWHIFRFTYGYTIVTACTFRVIQISIVNVVRVRLSCIT